MAEAQIKDDPQHSILTELATEMKELAVVFDEIAGLGASIRSLALCSEAALDLPAHALDKYHAVAGAIERAGVAGRLKADVLRTKIQRSDMREEGA